MDVEQMTSEKLERKMKDVAKYLDEECDQPIEEIAHQLARMAASEYKSLEDERAKMIEILHGGQVAHIQRSRICQLLGIKTHV